MEHIAGQAGVIQMKKFNEERSSIPKPAWWRAADKQAAAMEDCRAGRESDMRCSKK
jgi:hypothetical protein